MGRKKKERAVTKVCKERSIFWAKVPAGRGKKKWQSKGASSGFGERGTKRFSPGGTEKKEGVKKTFF